jgi:integrase
MKGHIRTKERCPKCKEKYKETSNGLTCPQCFTVPKRYYIDLFYKKQIKIYSDESGHPLDSYQRTFRLLEHIRHKIDRYEFDLKDYIKSEASQFYFSKRIDQWLEDKQKEVKKGNLAPSYTKILKTYIENYFKPFLKDKDIRSIKTLHIKEFYQSLPSLLSLKYQKNILGALSNFFNDMLELELISKKPIFPEIEVPEYIPNWTNRETQDYIISFIPQKHQSVFIFLTRQGIRPGEARALKVKDVDLENYIVIPKRTFSYTELREKTKSKKIIPRYINPELIPLLRQLCEGKYPDDFVFLNLNTNKPYHKDALQEIWRNAAKKAGINIKLYEATRHSVASIAASAGAPLQSIRDALGHTDIRTTLKYAKVDVRSQKAVFDAAYKNNFSRVDDR